MPSATPNSSDGMYTSSGAYVAANHSAHCTNPNTNPVALHTSTNVIFSAVKLVSDIAIFALKRDVKLQLTN